MPAPPPWLAKPIRLLRGAGRRLLPAFALAVLIVTAAAAPAQAAGTRRADQWRDALGRPLPWGQEVRGARLSVRLVRDRLLYGEPVEFLLDTRNPSPGGPFVRVRWAAAKQTARVEITTEAGEVVPFTREAETGYSELEGDHYCVRLWPGGKFARGRYFAPGKYRLRVTVDARQADGDGNSWLGKLAARVPFEVLREGADRAALVPEPRRRKAAALARDLGADRFAVREAGEKGLGALGPEALPFLEEALGSKSAEAVLRARRILKATLGPLLHEMPGLHRYPVWHDGAPLLVYAGERTWAWIREQFPGEAGEMLAAQAAAFGPVDPYRDMTELPRKEAAALVARLRNPDVAVRIRAIRSLSRTTNKEVLRALVCRLADPSFYWLRGPGDPAPFHLAAFEARQAIAWQGKPAVGPLLDFGRAREHRDYRSTVARLLADIEPHPHGPQYYEEQWWEQNRRGR